MQPFRMLILGVVLAFPSTSGAETYGDVSIAYFEELQELRYLAAEGNRKASATGPAALSFNALGRAFDLQLDSNDRVLSTEVRATLPGDIRLYRGKISGAPDSWVRLVMFDGNPSGLIWDGTELLAIEAAGDSAVGTTTSVIYRVADAYMNSGVMDCGVSAASTSVGDKYAALATELGYSAAQAAGALSRITIGAVGDFEFATSVGGDAAAAIATRINNVDGIFSEQVGVQVLLQANDVFATADDPFTSTTDPSTLLSELGQYRRNTAEQMAQGLTHLFTGRDLDGTRVGLANIGVLCNNRFSVGLTQGTRGAAMDSLVAAHEIGHNFGAPHDAEVGSACASVLSGFIMAPTIRSDASQFSSCSIEQMQPTIEAASCITTLLSVDVSISDVRTSPNLLLGDDANLDITVGNLGSEQSTNVQLDITMPEIVTYVSSSASSGTCSEGAGQLACQLGTLPGGGTNSVRIVTRTAAPGAGSFRVSLSADVDENPDNNQALAGITVDPAVDLVVTSAGRAQVTRDEASTVSVSLDNLAPLAATNAVLTVTLDAGLRADSASWSIGSCAIDGQQISCQAGNFPALSSATLTAEVTGIAAGQHEYHATITSAEADRDDTNNNASGVVTVNTPGGSGTEPQGDNGGGGSIGMTMLSLLFIVWLRMRLGHSAASMPRRA